MSGAQADPRSGPEAEAADVEQVYVVPRAALFPGPAPQGFFVPPPGLLETIRREGAFAPRPAVEEDPSRKQIIPYAVVARDGEVFCFRRSRGGGERRLHGLRSIGVGGHVNPCDGGDVVANALRRELGEELWLPPRWEARIVGLMNDDATAVGSVHLGVVVVVEPGAGAVRVREEDTMSGSFLGRDRLLELHAAERDSFEGWSALLLDRFHEVLPWPRRRDWSSPIPSATPISSG